MCFANAVARIVGSLAIRAARDHRNGNVSRMRILLGNRTAFIEQGKRVPFFLCLITNRSRVVLYIGVTNDLARRVWEHKDDFVRGFTSKYKMDRLVYYEQFPDPRSAIQREKEIKAWRREKRMRSCTP